MEQPDETPRPRTPPPRSFEQLSATSIALNAGQYASHSKAAPRFDAYDYENERNLPRWSDEEFFYDWLIVAALPKELAELLYYHAPEVSFLLGPGSIAGVEEIIECNSSKTPLRQAGFFQLASCSNGDPIVIALHGAKAGEVSYLPHEKIQRMNPDEIRTRFIPVIRSIGDFFEAFSRNETCELPRDYYDARDRGRSS